jgi:hypothetical protein
MKSNDTPTSSVRDLLVERLDALLADCDQVMDASGYGQTFNDLDNFLLTAGKQFLRDVCQQKLQERVKPAEQKAENKQCPNCKKKRSTKTRNRKQSSVPTDT